MSSRIEASCTMRVAMPGCRRSSACMTLIAARRGSTACCASNTVPIPPRPISRTIRYEPTTESGPSSTTETAVMAELDCARSLPMRAVVACLAYGVLVDAPCTMAAEDATANPATLVIGAYRIEDRRRQRRNGLGVPCASRRRRSTLSHSRCSASEQARAGARGRSHDARGADPRVRSRTPASRGLYECRRASTIAGRGSRWSSSTVCR